jgi:opacity protein-like surface antigen
MRKMLIALAGSALVVTLAVPAGASMIEPQRGGPGMAHAGHGGGGGYHFGDGDRRGRFGDHGDRGRDGYGYCGRDDRGGRFHNGYPDDRFCGGEGW